MRHPGRAAARLTLRVMLLGVAVIALAAAPSASARPYKMIWGPVTLPNGASAFPTYHKLGVRVLQIDLKWYEAAPTQPANPQDPSDPAYQWPAELDQAVTAAGRYHIRLCLLVDGTPPWANGSLSPANIVIGGNTWSFGQVEPADFVRWMKLPDGKPPPLDYYGHNPFGRRFPNLKQKPYFPGGRDLNDIDTLEAQLRGIYHRRVKLWLSEYTISSNHPTDAFDFSVSRKAQARWLTAAFKLVNSVNYVAGLGWFNLIDDAPHQSENLTNGLLTWRLKPKPAFYAYEHAR